MQESWQLKFGHTKIWEGHHYGDIFLYFMEFRFSLALCASNQILQIE